MTLNELAVKHDTDKQESIHNYMEKYERHLGGFRGDKINIVEIGIALGASLKVWRDAFPLATIWGIDIESRCLAYGEERVKILIGDQSNESFLDSVTKKIGEATIIIDDGSHINAHHQITFNNLFTNLLVPDGVYVIEDTVTCYQEGGKHSGHRAKLPNNTEDYFKNKIGDLNFNGKIEGFGNKQRDFDFVTSHSGVDKNSFSYWEEYIKGMSFYKNMIFIEKDNGFKRSDNEKN